MVPEGGFELKVFYGGVTEVDKLPDGLLCFNALLLPQYPRPEVLKDKLGRAIDYTSIFAHA